MDYDGKNVTFTGYVFILNTPQFKVVKRSAYGEGTNYIKEIAEDHRQNCYIPTSGHCFIKCIKFFTNKDYAEEILTLIGTEKYRPGAMTSARIQPLCKNKNFNIGYFDGTRINPRNITQKNTSLFIHNNHF